jgi:ABC-2 type transport system ATP-binding protein
MDSISVKNLVVKFKDFTAVNDISFNVPKGQVFGFLGPNGAGKTTTIKVLTTLLEKTSGEVTVAGTSLEDDHHDIRRKFGIVFQDQSLDEELTAFENMEFHGILYGVPKVERRKKIAELLGLIELTDRANDLVRNFSGGMKRRLEIARALLHVPEIIFLDEPTLGLDPQTRNHIWTYIKSLNKQQGVTVFFTTHYMEEAARMADRLAIIDHGKIVASGTAIELQAQTETTNLEDAFLKLTGEGIRAGDATSVEGLRNQARMWGGKK